MRRLKRETKFGEELNLIMMTKLVVFNKGHRKKSLSISEKQGGRGASCRFYNDSRLLPLETE